MGIVSTVNLYAYSGSIHEFLFPISVRLVTSVSNVFGVTLESSLHGVGEHFFMRLERLHGLDRENPHHLWLLHKLFLDLIEEDCRRFEREWNNHPISGRTMQNMTPIVRITAFYFRRLAHHSFGCQAVRVLSPTVNGRLLEEDDFEDVRPELLERYYGVDGLPRRQAETGAGHPDDEQDEEEEDEELSEEEIRAALELRITEDQQANIRHEPIEVPDHRNPFDTPELELAFWDAVREAEYRAYIPGDMYLTEDEWDEDGYPVSEEISVGKRNKKTLTVPLPTDLWYPRALSWCIALDALTYCLLP